MGEQIQKIAFENGAHAKSNMNSSKNIDKEEVVKSRFFVFQIEKQLFAFEAHNVREVIIDHEVYYLPFVPDYILGLINRHGSPYTVVDLKMLLENKRFKGNKFIVMNIEDDNLIFIITDILDIIDVADKDLNKIETMEKDYFLGSFDVENTPVFILDVNYILNRIKNDIL